MLKAAIDILQSATTILLVDWPSATVPRTLVDAGFSVLTYSPRGYSRAGIFFEVPEHLKNESVFPPAAEENGYLIFQKLNEKPPQVDIVNVYRPSAELPGIIKDHVKALGAKTLWLQPPMASAEAKALAMEAGVLFIDNIDIAAAAKIA